MTSQTERVRQQLLDQLNSQARLVEQRSPDAARELNVRLQALVDWMTAWLQKTK
jgi:hypothetical protein